MLLKSFFYMLCEMAPYLLLGFLMAGLLREFAPKRFFEQHLGRENFRSVLWATLLGIPLPLCSCGVIPTGVALRKNGASRGATTAFLIATPQVGVDSIIATYSLMGLPFAICRPLVALFTAIAGGTVTAYFGKDRIEVRRNVTCAEEKPAFGQRILRMLHYACIEMIQNIGKWLVIGLLLGSLITVFIPEDFFAGLPFNNIVTMLIVLLIAIPMYTCSMGSIPIATALILKGLSPGAALVLLVAGPAASIASMMVIGKTLGKRQLLFYLGSIIVGSLIGGICIDLLPREWFSKPVANILGCCAEAVPSISIFQWICAILFIVLFIIAFSMKLFHKNKTNVENGTVYRIEGMRCTHCQAAVEKAIRDLKSVESVEVNLKKGTASVVGTVDEEEIARTVTEAGFIFKGRK